VIASRILGLLGAAMVGGYLAERLVRHRLTVRGWHSVESSVSIAGLALGGATAVFGLGLGTKPVHG
jgi:hypothetical protein